MAAANLPRRRTPFPNSVPDAPTSDAVDAALTARDDRKAQVAPDTSKDVTAPIYNRDDVLAKLVEGMKKIVNRMEVMIMLLLALFLSYDEKNIQAALTHWETVRGAAFKQWLLDNTDHALALLFAIPMVIAAPVKKRTFVMMFFSIIWLFFPKVPLLIYIILFMSLLLYEQLSDGGARFIVIMVVGLIFIMMGSLVVQPNLNDPASQEIILARAPLLKNNYPDVPIKKLPARKARVPPEPPGSNTPVVRNPPFPGDSINKK